IAATVGGRGITILVSLGKLVALMYVGLAIFVVIVIAGVSWLIGVPFLRFVRAIREPFLIAFTTASSEAALPKAMEVMERFGVPNRIVAFVVPLGYSFNLDGTPLSSRAGKASRSSRADRSCRRGGAAWGRRRPGVSFRSRRHRDDALDAGCHERRRGARGHRPDQAGRDRQLRRVQRRRRRRRSS